MSKTAFATALVATLAVGQAMAADTPDSERFRIESEAQFVRDYGDRVEKVASGVYQVTRGALAGRTISIGEAGLDFDLALLNERMPTSQAERRALQKRIRLMEQTRQRYARARGARAAVATKAPKTGAFPCEYWPLGANVPVSYSGSATVEAETALYMLRPDGHYNPYYARASARASGVVYRPPGVPVATAVLAYASAHERQLGQLITRDAFGTDTASVSTGYVYSGPAFFHNLFATASVYGRGDCYGYVSISDNITPNF